MGITEAGLWSDCLLEIASLPFNICIFIFEFSLFIVVVVAVFIFFSNLNSSVHKLLFHPELKKNSFNLECRGKNKTKRKAVQITQEDF